MINNNQQIKVGKIKLSSLLTVFLFVFSFVYLSNPSSISAQSIIPLIVAPARQSIEADPGKSVNFSVRFYNTSEEPISGIFKASDFIVSDNLGTPQFLEVPTVLSYKFAAAKCTTLSIEKGTISGGGMITVNGTVSLPENASPGGKYFAVFFEPDVSLPSENGEPQQEASLVSTRIAGLIYLRVSGPISESASIVKFVSPSFSEYGPITITTEVKNGGVYHISPTGQITIKNIFGKDVSKIKVEGFNIFPEASRVIEAKAGEKWMIGRFSAELNLSYGETGKILSSTLYFWVFPWKLALIIALGIAIIILVISMITNRFIKKEKKLEEALEEEKDELQKLKEKYQDLMSSHFGSTPDDPDTPKE